jgi:hypothetical protein
MWRVMTCSRCVLQALNITTFKKTGKADKACKTHHMPCP